MAGLDRGWSFLDRPDLMKEHIIQSPLLDSPLKLPHRPKLFTLSLHSSAESDDDDSTGNLPVPDSSDRSTRFVAQKRYPEVSDLGAIAAKNEAEAGMKGESTSCGLPGEEEILRKKKFLAQLTGLNPGAAYRSKTFYDSGSQAFHESSNSGRESSEVRQSFACRVCRFCGREFPSGRALGGHMRVHGALLDAQLRNLNQVKEIQHEDLKQRLHAEIRMPEEKLGSREAGGAFGSNKECEDGERSVMQDEEADSTDEGREEKLLMRSPDESLDAYNCTENAHDPQKGKESRLLDMSYLKYMQSSGSHGSERKFDSPHTAGMEIASKANNTAIYELRPNPKPSQRITVLEEQQPMPFSANCRTRPQSASQEELPLLLTAEDMQTSGSPEITHPCSECGKQFPSWKALFGHMRCHPEREWRGIHRPGGHGSRPDFDAMSRMIPSRAPSTADCSLDPQGFDQTKSSCFKAGFAEKSLQSHAMDSSRAHLRKTKCMNVNSIADLLAEDWKDASRTVGKGNIPPKSHSGAKFADAFDLDVIAAQHEGKEIHKEPASRKYSSENKLQESMAHSPLEICTEDWTPSWSTAGKRSKRRRISHLQTANSSLNSNQKTADKIMASKRECTVDGCEDMADLLDPAQCLVLLSKSRPLDKPSMECTEESALSHPMKPTVRRMPSILDRWGRSRDGGLKYCTYDDDEAEEQENDGDGDGNEDDADNQAEIKGCGLAPALTAKYQCATCKKCFNSHQALGGHRASHRKMKGCFARTKSLAAYHDAADDSGEENDSDEPKYHFSSGGYRKLHSMKLSPAHEERRRSEHLQVHDPANRTERKKFKGHECSICHRVFVTGQALGGHKRCHWTGEKLPPSSAATGMVSSDAASVASSCTESRQNAQEREEWECRSKPRAKEDVFDLNLLPPMDEDDHAGACFTMAAACGASMAAKSSLPNWKQHEDWYPAKVVQFPQVCSVENI